MSERRDPPRLKDEPHAEWPAGFRDALAGYASSGPSAEVCGKVVERVEARIGSQAVAGASWKLPWWMGVIIVAVGTAGWFAYGRPDSRGLQQPKRDDSTPSASSRTRAPHVDQGSAGPVITDVVVVEPANASPTAAAGEPALSMTSGSDARVRTTRPPLPAAPRHSIQARAPERARAVTSGPTTALTPSAEADSRAELALLIRARSVLSSAPGQALALTEEHAARFRHSAFEEEREVLAIDAERRLGRMQSAAERARRFLKAHPSSIHRFSVESSAHDR